MITDQVYQSLIGQSQAETARLDRKSSDAAQMGANLGRQISQDNFRREQMSVEQQRYEREQKVREAMFDINKRQSELQYQDLGLKYQASKLALEDQTEQAKLDTEELPMLRDYTKTLQDNPDAQVPVFKSKSLQNQALQLQRSARTSNSAQLLQKVNEDNLLNQNKQVTDWLANNPDKTMDDIPMIKNQQGNPVPNMGLITSENRARDTQKSLDLKKAESKIQVEGQLDLINARSDAQIKAIKEKLAVQSVEKADQFKDKTKLAKYQAMIKLANTKLGLMQNEEAQKYLDDAEAIFRDDQATGGSTSDPDEGKTAVNPSTGEKLIRKAGKWQPLK